MALILKIKLFAVDSYSIEFIGSLIVDHQSDIAIETKYDVVCQS